MALTGEELGGQAEGLFIVADGMGGRASGAVASSIAVDAVREAFLSAVSSGVRDLGQALSEGFRAANEAVYQEAASKPELQGMGTTCAAAAVRDGRVFFAHLGDSRIYLLRGGELCRLTEDHSFVAEKVRAGEITEEEARKSRFRNVITRAVGLEPDAQPAIGSAEFKTGDVLLLCTDGLTMPVSDGEIADVLGSSSDPEEACGCLVNAALLGGGTDNVTVVVAAYGGLRAMARRGKAVRDKRSLSWMLPALVGLVLGIGIGVYPGRALLPRLVKPSVEGKSPAPWQARLAQIAYDDPISLLYLPLQGGLLALDNRGYVYVVDSQGRLIRLDASGGATYTFPRGDIFKRFPTARSPMIATDPEGNLYVSDPEGKRILKFGSDGLFLRSIGEGKLSAPEALAVDSRGSIYVIDAGRLKAIRPKRVASSQ